MSTFRRPAFHLALLAMAFCALLCPAAAASDPALDAPPPGLGPTTATLTAILAQHDKAVGALPAGTADTTVQQWNYVDTGMAATLELQRAGTNYHSRIVAAPLIEQFGQNAGGRWHQDYNGVTSATTAIDDQTFYAIRVREDAADPKNDVAVLGETTGANPAYVLKVVRSGYKHPEYLFYDKAGGQIVRVERVVGKRRWIETYDDFRTTDGVTTAWHFHDTDGRPELDDDWTLHSMTYGNAIPASTFDKPADAPAIARVATPTDLNAGLYSFGFVVRLNVQGRGLDFLVDSSSPISYIDRDVAGQLNLPTFGQHLALASGKHLSYDTLLASGDVGSKISFRNFAVRAADIAFQPDPHTRIVGVLGYDFLAANVLKFDFYNGKLEALPLQTLATTPVPDGVDIPLVLDDGSPIVTIGIGSVTDATALVSTADPFTQILGAFTYAHPEELKDIPHSNEHHSAIVPFADGNSFGVTLDVWIAIVSDLHFGIGDFKGSYVPATNEPMFVNERDIDAVLGLNSLQFYDLYFDYPNGRFVVKPNPGFYKTFHSNG